MGLAHPRTSVSWAERVAILTSVVSIQSVVGVNMSVLVYNLRVRFWCGRVSSTQPRVSALYFQSSTPVIRATATESTENHPPLRPQKIKFTCLPRSEAAFCPATKSLTLLDQKTDLPLQWCALHLQLLQQAKHNFLLTHRSDK